MVAEPPYRYVFHPKYTGRIRKWRVHVPSCKCTGISRAAKCHMCPERECLYKHMHILSTLPIVSKYDSILS